MKAAIKREESDACISFSECEQARSAASIMNYELWIMNYFTSSYVKVVVVVLVDLDS